MSFMSTVMFVMGPPYSGKSEAREKFFNGKDTLSISLASVHSHMSKDRRVDSDTLLWGEGGVLEQVINAIKHGFDVALEATFSDRSVRVKLIQEIRIRAPETRVVGLLVDVNVTELRERFDKLPQRSDLKPGAWQRARRALKDLKRDPPLILDGFDMLSVVNGKGELVEEKTLPEERAGKIEVRRFT